ncbi:gliding motility protein GldN [Hugenholtzia roseola]|uniref:type IX secretion system ring protein PorN/GldN n=1 Tax=Hugenholtzia roseola TaxID=1002 RepID=UPI0004186996|nr:gliding motility protein GldN [Hugenholtzia roseola]
MKAPHFFSLALVFCLALTLTPLQNSFAQTDEFSTLWRGEEGYNANSLRPVAESDIALQKTLWYRLSLKEKQNKPLFARQNEITRLLIEATKLGIIRPYENDSLRTRMSYETFFQRLKIPTEGLPEDPLIESWGTDETDWVMEGWDTEAAAEVEAQEFMPQQLYILELKENLIFDKKRARQIHDIQAITLYIPAELNPNTGLEMPLATFSYKEVVELLFRDNPKAIWYNAKNGGEHRNLEEAFDLRLFSAKIIKYDNIDDEYLIDLVQGDSHQALIESDRYEAQTIERENNLFEN